MKSDAIYFVMNVLIFCQFDFKVPIHGRIKILWWAMGWEERAEKQDREKQRGKGETVQGKEREKREGNEVEKGGMEQEVMKRNG